MSSLDPAGGENKHSRASGGAKNLGFGAAGLFVLGVSGCSALQRPVN